MAAENPVKTTKDALEKPGEEKFVEAIVSAYVKEVLLYGGTPAQIVKQINTILQLTVPEWAIDKETNELFVLKEDSYSKLKTTLWDLYPPASYAARAHNAVENVFEDDDQSVTVSEKYSEIFFQTNNQYGHGGEDTKGRLESDQDTFYRFPASIPTRPSFAGAKSSTLLNEFDVRLFLQLYRDTGIASRGAGPAGENDVSDGIWNFAPMPKYHITLRERSPTGSEQDRYRYVPILKPLPRKGWVVDQNPGSAMEEYLTLMKIDVKTGPEMKVLWEDVKPTDPLIGSGKRNVFVQAGRGTFEVRGYSDDLPQVDGTMKFTAGDAWKEGVLWIGYEVKPHISWDFGAYDGGTYKTYPYDSYVYRGSYQSIAWHNMAVMAAIASMYPGLCAKQLEPVLKDFLTEAMKKEKAFKDQYDVEPDTVFTKEKINPNVAGLKPFDEQCFLLENIRGLTAAARRRRPWPYTHVGIIDSKKQAPGNLISYINHGKKDDEVNALLNLCPDVYALLMPHIRVYRVDYKKDKTLVPYKETEIPFPKFIDPGDIKAITDRDYGRFPGAGIKSFSWKLDGVNPAEVENNISANLQLHFQTVRDFFALNPDLKAGDKQAGYLDLVIGSGTSFLEKPTEAVGSNPDDSTKGACNDARIADYEGERFRIKIVVGWSTPPGFQNMVQAMDGGRGKDPDYGKNLQMAIENSRLAFYLQNTTHEIRFNENGSLDLDISYQASLTGILRAPNADIFTGGTEYDAKIEKLEEKLEKKNDEIEETIEDRNLNENTVGEIPELQKLQDQKQSILEELDSLLKKEKSFKYKRFLAGLYDSGNIYSLKVPRDEFKLLKDLSPSRRAAEARKRLGGSLRQQDFEPQNPSKADLDTFNAFAEQQVNLTKANTTEAKMANSLLALFLKRSIDKMQASEVEIPFFYLGDFIDSILNYIKNIVTDDGVKTGSFQFLIGEIELIDPLLAFQIKEVDIKCDNARNVIISRALADINPLKFRGLNQIKFKTSMANLPISLEYFQEWFVNNVVRVQREKYPFMAFIKHVCSSLIAKSFNSTCFDDALKFHLRFDTNIFNFDESFSGKVVDPGKLATSKYNADQRSQKMLTPESKPILPSIVLYSVDSQPTTAGDYKSDLENGIYHYYIGAMCGIAKSIKFQRQQIPYMREARIGRTSALSAVQLQELYNAQLAMVGNNLHRNGQYIYINPVAIGAGGGRPKPGVMPTFAQLLGIGGYYMIQTVSHKVSAAGFEVNVSALQEGLNFASDGNQVVSYAYHSGAEDVLLSIGQNPSEQPTSADDSEAAVNLSPLDASKSPEMAEYQANLDEYHQQLRATAIKYALEGGLPDEEAILAAHREFELRGIEPPIPPDDFFEGED